MKFYGVLVLLVSLPAAYGLTCYNCVKMELGSCTETVTCPPGFGFDYCVAAVSKGLVTKSCAPKSMCSGPLKCCDWDLCNGVVVNYPPKKSSNSNEATGSSVVPSGSSVLFLLVSSAITSVFL